MAGPGLPTNLTTGSTGHIANSNSVHGIVNKLDTAIGTAATGNVLTWNGTVYAPAAPASSGGTSTSLGYANVLDYGAVGNGTTNCTTAFANAAATGKIVWVPPGNYYGTYDLDVADAPRFIGADAPDCTITIAAGHRFIDGTHAWSNAHLENLTFVNGVGALRNRFTGTNVTNLHRIIDCTFTNYTGAAISTNVTDGPFWKILRCLFSAATDLGTMGVALRGLTDKVTIEDCEWQLNQIDIKLDVGGNDATISKNDFVHYAASTAGRKRARIWLVPSPGVNNAGAGLTVRDNKFGNENIGVDDYHVLVANEGTGTYFGDRFPVFTTSTGYVSGGVYDANFVAGGDTSVPFIYSTTGSFQANRIKDIVFGGGMPSYVLQYLSASQALAGDFSDNVIGPVQAVDGGANIDATNRTTGAVTLVNPTNTAHSTNLF